MDAFEQLVSEVLWVKGFWVQTNVKVELTGADRNELRNPSSPRPEIDIVAYSPGKNTLDVIECKSFISSKGIQLNDVLGRTREAGRYRLFNDPTWRTIVLNRLIAQFEDRLAQTPMPTVRIGLACGYIRTDAERERLHAHFHTSGWLLYDDRWIREHLQSLATEGYENKTSAIVAKMLLRNN